MRFARSIIVMLILPLSAWAHPSVDNSMEVIVARDRVTMRAKISLIELDIAHSLDDGTNQVSPTRLKQAIDEHAGYLLEHLHVGADNTPLQGRIIDISPAPAGVTWENFEEQFVAYHLEYPIAALPRKIRIEEDLLKEFTRLGQPWMVLFVAQVRQDGEEKSNEMLLSRDAPLEFSCRWNDEQPPRNSTWHTASQYLLHGMRHILTGYDHLLFVAALVLAATKLWDLVKVVTAFAIAHTLTLTLAVLHLVRLPSSVVEPIIAASIVFVALQNVLFPEKSRGRARLVVAFAFGLFHGLGFAGGLMDAMAEMPATSLAVALISFTLGVELAHQVLIVPLFLLIKPLRRAGELPAQLRFASLAISLAGMFFLVSALREVVR